MLILGAVSYAQAQTTSPTPDPFVTQITSSPGGFYSFANDISANGRFVVFESNGDVSTEKIPSKNPDGTANPNARNNEDGNREIFLLDYAQRRIFQITNTKNVQKPPASPTPTPTATPTPSASPTPTPSATPPDLSQVKIEISNNRPMITLEPALVAGKRVYTIVFSSNAPNPKLFDGTDSTALTANANQEIWIYQLPAVDDTLDLTTGDDAPFQALADGTFRQITDTTPSRPLRATTTLPDVIDDNREAMISDDGNTIAFISTRNPGTTVGNSDANGELFFCRTSGGFATGALAFVQATNTKDTVAGISDTLQQNPSLSADGGTVAFLSRANLASANDDKNPEIYVADFSGTGLTNVRQITKTKSEAAGTTNAGLTLNLLSPGRRLSRNGKFVAYESRAEDPVANTGTNTSFLAMFVSDVPASATTANGATRVGLRATAEPGDVVHFPMFSDYDGALAPHSLVFASTLNFKPDGTLVGDQDTTGLNSVASGQFKPNQIFATQIPVTSSNTFTRLTKNPVFTVVVGLRPIASNTLRRITFSLAAVELGGGNTPNDGSSEVYYLLTPPVATEATAALSFFTGASDWGPISSASPSASPTPTPSPSPGLPAGLAPGELSIVRSTVGLAASDKTVSGVDASSETKHSPILPIELNGVSVSINGAAAGLYFVGDAPSEGIRFVVPIGLGSGVATVVVNNRGTTYRGFVLIVPAQPDIFSVPFGPGGTAVVCNVTNTASGPVCVGPFPATSADSTGTQVPTKLQIQLTGVRFAAVAETKVSFVNSSTTVDVVPDSVGPNRNMFGVDFVNITLPSTLAGAAPIDYKLIVTVTRSSVAFTSRPADTAPTVTIAP
jgi:hypothetical protein